MQTRRRSRPGVPRDPGVEFDRHPDPIRTPISAVDPNPLVFLEQNIGAFDPANPIEIRQNGDPSLGALGINVPSLLGVGHNAPYFHNGLAQTLEEVFEIHQLPGGGTIADLAGGGRPARLRQGDRRPNGDLPLGRRPLPRAGHDQPATTTQ